MGKTKLHIEKAKYSRGNKMSSSLENHFDRLNNDWGELRKMKTKKKEKQIKRELRDYLNNNE